MEGCAVCVMAGFDCVPASFVIERHTLLRMWLDRWSIRITFEGRTNAFWQRCSYSAHSRPLHLLSLNRRFAFLDSYLVLPILNGSVVKLMALTSSSFKICIWWHFLLICFWIACYFTREDLMICFFCLFLCSSGVV